MANTIGGYEFIRIDGEPDVQAQNVEAIPTPYKDGNAYRKTHIRGEETELSAIRDCTNLTSAATLLQNYKNLQGTVVDIVKDGVTYSNWLITKVKCIRKQQGAKGVGGITPHGSAVIEMSFTCVDVNTP